MTEVQLRGEIGAPTLNFRAAQARFDAAFAFEEPIAVTLRNAADGRRMTRWLVAGQASPVFALRATDETPRSESQRQQSRAAILDYLRFGFEHILPRGLDHVLFVLGLYLGTKSLRSLLLLVTTFTLAHSVTLILSSFGAIRLRRASSNRPSRCQLRGSVSRISSSGTHNYAVSSWCSCSDCCMDWALPPRWPSWDCHKETLSRL
jgi:hypothetical protein